MRPGRILAIAVLVGLAPAGCYANAKPDLAQLRHRASLDLHCRQALGVHPAGPRTQLVRGCGQEAVYVHDCNVASDRYGSWETDCTWRLDRQPGPIARAR
jgi:hypothetical protein